MNTPTHYPCCAVPSPSDRSGFSLLEVLISTGILVVGLASIAALIPAAADRMRQAVVADRSGALAANAYADIMARKSSGILKASHLAGGSTAAFGKGGEPSVNPNGLLGKLDTHLTQLKCPVARPANGPFGLFQNSGRDFDNQDNLEYTQNGINLPDNLISGTDRSYSSEVCWLATISTSAVSPSAGDIAELSIAVFRKSDGDVKILSLTRNGGVFTVNPSGLTPEPTPDDLRFYLKGCGYVLDASTSPVTWRRMTSVWSDADVNDVDSDNDTTEQVMRVIFSPAPTASLSVIAFENLVRVDTHSIRLD